jgi:hypothetical protein
LQYQDYKFLHQTSAGIWRWTTRVDLSGTTPVYSVLGIVTPWGLYREDAPIPGGVIQDMAGSIATVQQAFPPVIVIGPPTSLTFDVDEGRGFSEAQMVTLANGGVWGSLLGVTLSPSDSWVTADPPVVGGMASGNPATVAIAVDSTTLQSALGPYHASVTVTDPTATNNPQAIPVTVNVRPKSIIATDVALLTFYAIRPVTGCFPAIPTQEFQLRNDGPLGALLSYQIQKLVGLSDWLAAFSPPVGDIVGQDSLQITVLVQPPTGMAAGTYEETLRISGYSENHQTDVLIRLVVT